MTAITLKALWTSRRLATGGVVLLAHLVLTGLLWQTQTWGDRDASAPVQQPLKVRLLWITPTPPAAPPPAPAEPRRGTTARLQPTPRVIEPQAITDPSDPALRATADAPSSAPAVVPATHGSTAPATLDLTLPRGASAPWRQRNMALDDPRANSAKLTLDQKLANAMGGDGSWVMERVDVNTIRYRRGSECVQKTRSRAGQLELGGGAYRNAWLVGNC